MYSNESEKPKCCYFSKIILDHQEWPLRQCGLWPLLNTLGIPITIQRGRKLGYALPEKTKNEMTENVKKYEVLDCPNNKYKICILGRLKKIKISSGLIKSLKSEMGDGPSSCSNFYRDTHTREIGIGQSGLTRNRTLKGEDNG